MAQYEWANYRLEFNNDYTILSAVSLTDPAQNVPYDLTLETQLRIQTSTTGEYWELDRANCVNTPKCMKHGFRDCGDIGLIPNYEGNPARWGGTGMIDLRDLGRQFPTEVVYYLEHFTFHLQNIGTGVLPLKLMCLSPYGPPL